MRRLKCQQNIKEHSMYEIEKTIEFSACHMLNLDYDSKCNRLHGHNYMVRIFCRSEELNHSGMVTDFTHIKEELQCFDHNDLNRLLGSNPTSEIIAMKICGMVDNCWKVEVSESRDNKVTYIKEK